MTGYVVHYSDGDTDRNESVPASSTSSLITGLTINITYNFSVEATSEHLSAESTFHTISLGKFMFEANHTTVYYFVCVNLLYRFPGNLQNLASYRTHRESFIKIRDFCNGTQTIQGSQPSHLTAAVYLLCRHFIP